MKKKKLLFVDFPQLANGTRFELNQLFKKLGEEFDEIRNFVPIPRASNEERDVWGLIRVCTNAGGFPILCPSDVDGLIVEDIRKNLDRKDVKQIALLSGDNGYFEVLRTAKRAGMKIKIIIPPSNSSMLLRSLADETAFIDEYSDPFEPIVASKMPNYFCRNTMKGGDIFE